MELPSDEFAILQFYRTIKIQLGGLLPNIANLTLMSFTCHNQLVAVTQSTELFVQPHLEVSYLEDVQMDVKTEEVANVNKTLTLSSLSTSSSESEDKVVRKKRKKEKKCKVRRASSSDTENDESIRKVPTKQRLKRIEKLEAANYLAENPTQTWHNNLVPLNKLASLPMSRTSQLQVVTVNNQIKQLAPVLDAVELPIQGIGLQYKVDAGANFGEWIVPK